MKGLILLILLSGTSIAFADDVDYGALSNSLQYLETKWVAEPRRENIQNMPQYRQPFVSPPGMNFPAPTCQIFPITAPDGEIINYRKVCR